MSRQYHKALIRRTLPEWVEMMQEGKPFVQVGYSDAEWYCISRKRDNGELTGLGQSMTWEQGVLLEEVIRRRGDDPNWHFAMPEALWNGEIGDFEGDKVGQYLSSRGLPDLDIYERDIFTDYAARDALLAPLVRFLQEDDFGPVFIGPEALAPLVVYLKGSLIPISTPNLHQEDHGVDSVVSYFGPMFGVFQKSRIVLLSAGVSAAIIADRLYELYPQHTYFDCGSIWDAFVGIGGQRQWRADLYADPEKLQAWKDKNRGV